MTTVVKLRSRVMGNYQARFWRAVEGATPSLTLIIKVAGGHSETKNGHGGRRKSSLLVAFDEVSTRLFPIQLALFG
ncbi:MAG: hypothetical protein VKL42_00185 [Snowella sp.]|nr:hypothetical protein [Snowella sp.]